MLSGSSTLAVFHTSGTLPVAKIYLENDGQSQRYFFPAFKSPREQFFLVLVIYPHQNSGLSTLQYPGPFLICNKRYSFLKFCFYYLPLP